MIPTLFFAIPGSSSMAVMMAALVFVGVGVGPNMLTKDIGLSYSLAATVIVANLLAIPAFFMVVPGIVRLSALRREAIVPIAIAIAVTAALINSPRLATVVQVFVAAALGIGLKAANWPRAPFILGFVIAQMAESSFFLTATLWGWSALARPITLGLIILLLAWLIYSTKRRSPLKIAGPKKTTLALAGTLILFFGVTFQLSLSLPPQSGLAPMIVSGFSLLLCALIFTAAMRSGDQPESQEEIKHLAVLGIFLAATPIVGLPLSSLAFVTEILRRSGIRLHYAATTALFFCILQVALLMVVYDVLVEKEIIGRILWAVLGY